MEISDYIIKGRTAKIKHTFWSSWTGQAATSTLANLTGATVKTYIKNRDTDPDGSALLTLNGVITDAVNGAAETPILASDTRGLSYTKVCIESVAKLADGVTYISAGLEWIELRPNVLKGTF